jgi:autophagy-related protein 13
LKVPEPSNNRALVYIPPDGSRVKIERNKRYILLEQWMMQVDPGAPVDASGDKALPIIYKHGIVLFRSLFSLLRVLPAWKLHKRIHGKVGAGGMSIELRVRNEVPQEQIHMFGKFLMV